MVDLLAGLRIVEGASFIAGPSAALHLQQFGAEVIRFDQIGGGPDFGRWPLAPGGASLYWEALNKGKKSIALDLGSPEGREIAAALITAPGENAGLFVTNYPAEGFLSHERLATRRADLITLRIMGWADGSNALDYTVNSALGLPLMTGPEAADGPVNHVLPAWDIATGAYGAFALLAAERRRRLTGQGGEVRLPLGDVAMAMLGHIGMIGEASVSGASRPRMGNDLFGAFGRDFATADGRRIMIVALTRRQWEHLVQRLEIGAEVATLEKGAGVDLAADEGARFVHREAISALVAPRIAARTLADIKALFAGSAVCWGPYNALHEAMDDPALITSDNPLFALIDHPSGARYLAPGAAATFPGEPRLPPRPAPRLGEHTDEVLASVLGLPGGEIARLHDRGVIAGAAS